MCLEVLLQDNGGGNSIQPCFAFPPVTHALCQQTFGFNAGESFVGRQNWNRRTSLQCIDKGSNPRRLSVRRPIQADRQADHHGGQSIVLLLEPRNLGSHMIDSIADVSDRQRQ